MTSDLDVVGQLKVRPIWNTASSTEAFTINATNTQSGAGTSLIKAQVDGTDKFVVDKDGNITTAGSLTVAGTTTTINSVDLTISDKTVVVASGATDSTTVNDAGLQLGSSNLSFKYDHANTRWNLPNAGLNVGESYRIGGTEVLSTNTLGSGIVNSSLTSVGTLTSLNVDGASKIKSVTEDIEVRSASQSGTQTYDFAQRAIFYHPSVGGNITVALTNVPTDSTKAHSIAIVFVQGATARNIATTFGVNGTSVNVLWAGDSQPDGTANKTEAWNFTIVNTSTNATPTWTVIGSATTFG
jgi:hypothetical protein